MTMYDDLPREKNCSLNFFQQNNHFDLPSQKVMEIKLFEIMTISKCEISNRNQNTTLNTLCATFSSFLRVMFELK